MLGGGRGSVEAWLVCLVGFVMYILNIMLMFGEDSSWQLAWVSLGLGTGRFLRAVL